MHAAGDKSEKVSGRHASQQAITGPTTNFTLAIPPRGNCEVVGITDGKDNGDPPQLPAHTRFLASCEAFAMAIRRVRMVVETWSDR